MFMNLVGRVYQYINILSIDVVLGAIVGALFFGRLFNNPTSIAPLMALGLTVWIIYTADHLRDAHYIRGAASTERHRFHQRYFKRMSWLLVPAIALDIATVASLQSSVLIAGACLGMFVVVYLVLQRHLKFMKEIFVAFLYAAGVLVPSVSALGGNIGAAQYAIVGEFALTALMNLLLFSLIDAEADRSEHQNSFVTCFGARAASCAIVLLGLFNVVAGLWLFEVGLRSAVVFTVMNLTLLGVFFLSQYSTRASYYRSVGDAVFFMPAVFLV